MSEQELRRLARQRLSAGELPVDDPESIWGGNGSGQRCAVCAREIARSDVEYELQFRTGDPGSVVSYRFHRRCHAAWELERQA
jgi:hypothetical protein